MKIQLVHQNLLARQSEIDDSVCGVYGVYVG